MSNHEQVVRLMNWVEVVAAALIDDNGGERSILTDLAQEGLTSALASGIMDTQDLKNHMRRTMESTLRKHRERGYKRKMWQNSANEEFSDVLWGDNPDFG